MGDTNERRVHKRYRVQDGVFAVMGPFPTRMGQIIDISQGGLAFYHRDGNETTAGTHELSILFDNSENNVKHGPLKFQAQVVCENRVDDDTCTNNVSQKRCGLAFQDLTYYQRSWLAECIQNYTTEEKPE